MELNNQTEKNYWNSYQAMIDAANDAIENHRAEITRLKSHMKTCGASDRTFWFKEIERLTGEISLEREEIVAKEKTRKEQILNLREKNLSN